MILLGGSNPTPVVKNGHGNREDVTAVQGWFRDHVKLDRKPYFLDEDQARAVTDLHKNTLVTARAGSGKTRVIVAKVIYLVVKLHYNLDEIAIFMFNRTAAAEVNERIAAVEIDGQPLLDYLQNATHGKTSKSPCLWRSPALSTQDSKESIRIASTFHKFALDLVKSVGEKPELISESAQIALINRLLRETTINKRRFSPREYQDLTKLTHNFITRAGQKFPGPAGLEDLKIAVENYLLKYQYIPAKRFFCQVHQIAFEVYARYLASLEPPLTNFNLLMSRAAEILRTPDQTITFNQISRYKYLMVDEYQDFSDLFYNLVVAICHHCPSAKLFAVGDDWQAINRFAGSDVNYFLQFAEFFPEDSANIPLATNYRSCRRIVENANQYMLAHYDPNALPAVANNHKPGKIFHQNPQKIKFDPKDSLEDGLGDGLYQHILAEFMHVSEVSKVSLSAAKLLKALTKICQKHRHESIMLLHRHNFTSINNLTLDLLAASLRDSLSRQAIISAAEFDRQIRFLTMHRSKGLESDVVIILEADAEIIAAKHPHATVFELFGDTRAAEIADQQRLLYVAMTRAKKQLYILSSDQKPLI